MLLEFRNISKSFGEAEVLKQVSLQLGKGQVLGLLGENGAGKSTLMNVLGGVLTPTSGELLLDGKVFYPQSPKDAIAQGIVFIHQELNLFPNLSIAENLFLNNFPKKRILGISFTNRKEASKKTRHLLNEVGLEIEPTTLVEKITASQKQLIEIAKVLNTSPRIIIFDEPTTSLTRFESQKLFELIRKLKAQNIAIIYISHNLQDVVNLADQIAILRDGALVQRYQNPKEFHLPKIIQDMVGRDLRQFFLERKVKSENEIIFQVEGLSAGKIAQQHSFCIRKKEVVGFYGLVGSGRTEMARMIYGLDFFEKGTIYWKGKRIKKPKPVQWIWEKVAFLTEDRREEGLLLQQNIYKNIQLAALPRYIKTILNWLDYEQIIKDVNEQAKANQIKAQSLNDQLVAKLSGGNQQKVVLAKWLLIQPELLILDEPTKGIDIGAKEEIYRLINTLVEGGSSILLISSEIEELIGLCDRILVMNQGTISSEFEKKDFDRNTILEAALHKTEKKYEAVITK